MSKKDVSDDFDAISNIEDYLKGDLYHKSLCCKRVKGKKKR